MPILLIGCSNNKNRFLKTAEAEKMYVGTLLTAAMQYAKENALDVLILSAKYGFITPDTVIERYDQKMRSYNGPWPDAGGFYAGGQAYFKNAPERFKPLVKNAKSIGQWTSGVLALLKDKNIACGPRKQKEGGVTWHLYKLLLERKVTKEEALAYIKTIFKEEKNYASTINTQFSQCRIGNERGCVLHKEGGRYWLEPKEGIDLL